MTLIRSPYHLDEPIPALADGEIAAGSLAEIFERVASLVRTATPPPVVFSADCTTALGTVAGLQRAGLDPAIVWLDAHGDLNTPETSLSGYLGGMVLAGLTGRTDLDGLCSGLGLRPVPDRRTLLVDARDLDPAEQALLDEAEIFRCTVEELASGGDIPDGSIYLHLDLDVSGDLPAFRYKTAGGPAFSQVVASIDRVLATGTVVAFDIAATIDPAVEGYREALDAVRRTGWIDDEPLLVRRAQTCDADALIALWKSCDLSFDETQVAAELESCLDRQDGLIFVIASQSQVVASIWGTYDGRRGRIQRLATAPDQRGRGFAERLVALLEQRLADIGCRKINLLIEPDNSDVATFYESLGYTRDALVFMERFVSKAPKLTPRA